MTTNHLLFDVLVAGSLITGLCILVFGAFSIFRESNDKSILPWGPRMEVERERARTEIHQQHLEQEAMELKRLALTHRRNAIMQAIENDQSPDEVQALALPQPVQRQPNY